MSPEQLAQEALAAQLIGRCRGGFRNEFEWAAWAAKHKAEIDGLPSVLRASVLAAWSNASTPEASRASARSAPK